MSDRRRCGMPILPPLKGTTPLWQGHCQNAPLRGFQHCRHHLTVDERARRALPELAARLWKIGGDDRADD